MDASSLSSEGKGGIDFSISFLQLLRFGGDKPTPICGGETLFRLGEAILIPVVGDALDFRIVGVSSSKFALILFSDLS